MDLKRRFIVQFDGLKEGVHHFEFEVDDTFFTEFEGSLIDGANLKVDLKLDKKSNMLLFQFDITGHVKHECDHCGDPLLAQTHLSEPLIVKFGEVEEEEAAFDSLVVLPNSAYELNVAPFIYEFVVLALPLRNVHPEGDCNPEALARLEKMKVIDGEDDIDPRWNKLRELKNSDN